MLQAARRIFKNEAPRAKARGLLERNTQAAIFHPCPQGQGFLAANV